MGYELNANTGNLFSNDKGDNPKRPDYRGELLIDGTLYELAAWSKVGKKGKFLSLSVKPKPAKAPEVLPKVSGGVADMDSDDLPF